MYYFINGVMQRNTSVGLYNIDENGICIRVTVITGPLAIYRADEIIASIGRNANNILSYVMSHVYYYFVYVADVYNNPYNADWAEIAAYAMNRGYGACYHFAALNDILLQSAGYQTRIVVGTGYYPSLHCWNQIYVDGVWINYDGVSGFYGASTSYLMSLGFTFDRYVYPTYTR